MNNIFLAANLRGKELQFSTRDDYLRWLQSQAEFWQIILENSPSGVHPLTSQLFSIPQNFYNSTMSTSNGSDDAVGQKALDFINEMNANGIPEAGTPLAEMMREAALRLAPNVAHAMAKNLAGSTPPPRHANDISEVVGPVLATLARLPSLSSTHPLRSAALEEQERVVSARIQQSQTEIKRALDEASLATRHAEQFTADSRDEFERRWAIQHASATEQLSVAIDDFKNTEKIYKEHMKLRAPVHYWEEKRSSHNLRGWVTLGATVFFGLLALDTLRRELLLIADQVVRPNPGAYGLFKGIALAVLYSSVVLVSLRIALRIYMSERHLEIDASERVAMIKTYLALTAEDKISEVERPLVLSPIFRPATDGIVRDDGSTALPIEAITSKLIETAKPAARP